MNKYWCHKSKGYLIELICAAKLQPDNEEVFLYRRITGERRGVVAARSELFFKRFRPIEASTVESFVGERLLGTRSSHVVIDEGIILD